MSCADDTPTAGGSDDDADRVRALPACDSESDSGPHADTAVHRGTPIAVADGYNDCNSNGDSDSVANSDGDIHTRLPGSWANPSELVRRLRGLLVLQRRLDG